VTTAKRTFLTMDYLSLFKDKTIGDIWPVISPVITISTNTTIHECLTILEKHVLLSAPVLDCNQKLVAFVDILDIVLFITKLFPEGVPLEKINREHVQQVLNVGKQFDNTSILEVVAFAKSVLMYNDNVMPVQRNTHITQLLDMFYQGVHRVPVMSDDGTRILGVISQTDLLSILAQCITVLDQTSRTKTVAELELGEKELITVHKDTSVISVLMRMNRALKRPVSAVPVVDDTGRLIANFSASNLRELQKSNFDSILLPVLPYLERIRHEERQRFHTTIQSMKSLHPMTCTLESTFQSVVFNLVTNRVHRLWLVDKEGKPVGVISMSDIFKVFLPWTSYSPTTSY